MRVILVEDVKGLGTKGSVAEVADGYARNYLLPRGLVREATAANLADVERRQEAQERQRQREYQRAREVAERLAGARVVVPSRVGKDGRLFGSVTSKEIGRQLAQDYQVKVDRRKIELKQPLKTEGEFPVIIRLYPEVQVTLTVVVKGLDERVFTGA